MIRFLLFLFFLSFGLLPLQETKAQTMHTILALGDSYTIGEAVAPTERWPEQLVQLLREDGLTVSDPKIIATTGWTTDELQEAIKKEEPSEEFSLVTLLIGVNNQYRGYPLEQYRQEFDTLLQQAIGFGQGEPGRVVVVSIPDYGVTPFAVEKNPEKIAQELDEYNRISREIAARYGVKWVDITPRSRLAKDDPGLIASDGLHPSGKMYRDWATAVYPYALKIIANP